MLNVCCDMKCSVYNRLCILLSGNKIGPATVTEKSDFGWIALNSSGYHLHLEPMNWSDAQTHCHEKGASLLSLTSKAEMVSNQGNT